MTRTRSNEIGHSEARTNSKAFRELRRGRRAGPGITVGAVQGHVTLERNFQTRQKLTIINPESKDRAKIREPRSNGARSTYYHHFSASRSPSRPEPTIEDSLFGRMDHHAEFKIQPEMVHTNWLLK